MRTLALGKKGVAVTLATFTHISLDGVMQGMGGPGEDRRAGFERGGWTLPFRSAEGAAMVAQVFERADAFLFGRWTYELFAGFWGAMADSDHPIARALNTRPKYVASTTLTDPLWTGTTILAGDVAAAVSELKATSAGELQVHGSGTLIRWLLANRLVDEITLITYPVVVGQGARLFPAAGPEMALELVDAHATSGGLTIQVYRPGGPD